MERVQFQQEQMLDELKDLIEKKIFTRKEANQIMKKRTAYETALIRRVAKKSDFLLYASYEMGLDQLRRKRVERMDLPPSPPSISDYALVRRQFQIFERAVKKFKSDVGLWVQYIEVAKREGARALVGRITARALQMHPSQPALYILAASHELDNHSPSAARTLLQRGIRLNPDNVEMWREYVRMELRFIESLRRRWDVLGIDLGKAKGKAKAIDDDPASSHEIAELELDESAAARTEIMSGGIVLSVVDSAVQALPTIELFESLHEVIGQHPSPPELKQRILGHVYAKLRTQLVNEPRAMTLLANRFLTPGLEGEGLVDGLQHANEDMLERITTTDSEDVLSAYMVFVERWCGTAIDANLKRYLIGSLKGLIRKHPTSASLLSGYIRLMIPMTDTDTDLAAASKLIRTATKYSDQAPKSVSVWISRLEVEKLFGGDDKKLEKLWRRARSMAEGSEEEMEKLWTWGLWTESVGKQKETCERLLEESMRASLRHEVHEMLLVKYVDIVHKVHGCPEAGLTSDQAVTDSAKWLRVVGHMGIAYLTSGKVWRKLFEVVAGEEGIEKEEREQVLRRIFERWQLKEESEARGEFGEWLIKNGKVIEGQRLTLG